MKKNVMGGSVAGIVLAIGLAGCLHDKDGDNDSNKGVSLRSPSSFTLTKASSPMQGAQAATLSDQSAAMALEYGGANESDVPARLIAGSNHMPAAERQRQYAFGKVDDVFKSSRDIVATRLRARVRGIGVSRAAKAIVEQCELGGSLTVDGSETSSSFSYTATYAQCKEPADSSAGYVVYNGTVKIVSNVSESGGAETITIGDGDGELEDSDFTMKYVESGETNMSFILSYVETRSWIGDYYVMEPQLTYSIDGRIRSAMSEVTLTLSFDDFTTKLETDLQPTDGIRGSFTYNGALEVAMDSQTTLIDDMSLYLGFSNYSYSAQYDPATGGTRFAVDGLVAIETNEDVCTNGAYTFKTITPFQWTSGGQLIAGELTINSDVTVRANNTNGITVTVGGQSQEYADFDEMETSVCLL